MSMNKSTLITILIIVSIVVLAGWYTYSTKSETERESTEAFNALSVKEEQQSYTDLSGNPVDLTEYQGSFLVVNSWASWCPFCVNELPDLAKLGREFADQAVKVLAINREESKEQAERFIRTLENTEGVTFVLDPGDHFYDSVGGFSMPETVFYGPEGNVLFHKRGFMSYQEMESIMNNVLQE